MKTKNRILTIALSALVLLIACGEDKESKVNVSGVSLNSTSLSLEVNGSETLRATVTPAEATNKAVTWRSSDPTVASVDDGTVTALKEGTTTITVTTVDGGEEDTCFVTVEEHTDTPGLNVANNAIFQIPEAMEGIAIADIDLAAAVWGGTPPYAFALTSGTFPGGITLSDGVISGTPNEPTAAGTVKITVSDSSTPPLTKEITVNYRRVLGEENFVPVTGVTGVPERLLVGRSHTLFGTVTPETATSRNIRWSVVTGIPGATIDENRLTTTASGKMKLRATIPNGKTLTTDYTEDFDVEIYETLFISAENPETEDRHLLVKVDESIEMSVNAEIHPASQAINYQWYIRFGISTPVAINNATRHILSFTPSAEGLVSFHCILSAPGAANYHWPRDEMGNPSSIAVMAQLYPGFVPVTNIVNVPTTARLGIPLDLSGAAVLPENASVQLIDWRVDNPGGTQGYIRTVYGRTEFQAINTGMATLRAVVLNGKTPFENYTQTFPIVVSR